MPGFQTASLPIVSALALSLGILAGSPPASAAESGILACTAIADNLQRLACFDQEAVKLRTSMEQEARDSITFFGLFGRRGASEPEPRSADTAATPTDLGPNATAAQGKLKGITAHIVSVSTDPGGHTIVITDGNQVWRTIEGEAIRGGVPGAEITITESNFNGYRLKISGRVSEYRVQRIL